MSESTFLCLLYIYILYNKKHYNSNILFDFKRSVISVFKRSCDVHDFCLHFIPECSSLPKGEFRLCRQFVRFIRENNSLLGYEY